VEIRAYKTTDFEQLYEIDQAAFSDDIAYSRLELQFYLQSRKGQTLVCEEAHEIVGFVVACSEQRKLGHIITIDVIPLGIVRGNDVSVQKVGLPTRVKKSQTFETKIFVQADQAQPATVRLYRNDQPLGEQKVELSAGKNLFTFPQTLADPGFYSYTVYVEAPGDKIPQNNHAI
jgi:hypothetical protein